MEQNNKYEFRAITSKKQAYIGAVIWAVLFLILFPLSEYFFEDKINFKLTFIIIFFIVSILSILISSFFICKKITIKLENDHISFYKNGIFDLKIQLNEIEEISFSSTKLMNHCTNLTFSVKGKKIEIMNGLLFTFKKQTIILKDFYLYQLKEYMLLHRFQNITFTNKQIAKGGIKESFLPEKHKTKIRDIQFERERKEVKRQLKIISWENFFICVPLGIIGIVLLSVGISDLIKMIKMQIFEPHRYAKISTDYSYITGESIDTVYLVGIIIMTLLGLLLTIIFIYYLKMEFSYFLSKFKTNKNGTKQKRIQV